MVQLDIDQLAALSADSVIMPLSHPVKSACTIAKLYLSDMSGLFQKSQAVVNSSERNTWQLGLRQAKDLVCS
jgi:hypothetical protein